MANPVQLKYLTAKHKFALFAIIVLTATVATGCGNYANRANFVRVETHFGLDGQFAEPFGVAVNGADIFISDGQNGKVVKYTSRAGTTDFATGLHTPSSMAFAENGDLIVADSGSSTIKRIDTNGIVSLIAGVEGKRGFADGEVSSALFNAPVGVTVSEDGTIFVSDTYNDRIRSIRNGEVRTIAGGQRGYADGSGAAAQFDTPLGISGWIDGRVLVADTGNRRIRVVEPDGSVWTLAGDGSPESRDGLPPLAGFVRPSAVTVSNENIIYIADGNAVRAIGRRSVAYVETVAGRQRGFRDGGLIAGQFNRISDVAINEDGALIVTDSDNGLVRRIAPGPREVGSEKNAVGSDVVAIHRPVQITADEFRSLQPARWPFDPPDSRRDIAGTLGEIRGRLIDESSEAWFHNGLDIAGGYGETVRFVRDEKVLHPLAAENFNTLRELLRMPSLGYIHIRLGRDSNDQTYDDDRFVFEYVPLNRKISGVRVPRGATFRSGEAVGTLNAMNHVHLIAGPAGSEMNALAALELPGVSDSLAPTIEEISIYNQNWVPFETVTAEERITIRQKARIIVRAHDRMDGNPERRRLGVFRLGYQILGQDLLPVTVLDWNISFDRNPSADAVKFAYAAGSQSGATGETVFRYIVTNNVKGNSFSEGLFDPDQFEPGSYLIRIFAEDFFGNSSFKDIKIEVGK